MSNLDRFRQAQEKPHAGFVAALGELGAGRKTGHWIWYIFPQLAGLGRSPTAVHYGLAGAEDAADYLRDPVLGQRLIAAAAAVRAHLTDTARGPAALEELMGFETSHHRFNISLDKGCHSQRHVPINFNLPAANSQEDDWPELVIHFRPDN